jgi:hypothetical protein
MLIDQTDLDRGMSWEFTREIYAVTTTESFPGSISIHLRCDVYSKASHLQVFFDNNVQKFS